MRLLTIAAVLALAALALPRQGAAQAPCPIITPNVQGISVTSYSLTNNDECSTIIFTAPTVVTLTVPNANTLAPGFPVALNSPQGGIILNLGSPLYVSNATQAAVSPGQTVTLQGDGSKFTILNSGLATLPPLSANFSGLPPAFPGITTTNSETAQLPNAMLQFTNIASWPAMRGASANATGSVQFNDVCKFMPFDAREPGRMQWLRILDPFSRARFLPVCG